MKRVAFTDCAGFAVSRTIIVRPMVPVVVGVPVIAPPAERDKPAGSVDPEARLHVYGGVPPDAARVVE